MALYSSSSYGLCRNRRFNVSSWFGLQATCGDSTSNTAKKASRHNRSVKKPRTQRVKFNERRCRVPLLLQLLLRGFEEAPVLGSAFGVDCCCCIFVLQAVQHWILEDFYCSQVTPLPLYKAAKTATLSESSPAE